MTTAAGSTCTGRSCDDRREALIRANFQSAILLLTAHGSEKAREKRQVKKRPASAGPASVSAQPRQRQAHAVQARREQPDGDVFRRAPTTFPGSATLMSRRSRSMARDIYQNLASSDDADGRAFAFVRELADRTEGKPTQKHELVSRA